MKYFVAIVFLSALVHGRDDSEYFKKLDAIRPEAPCNRVGGICTFARDCPRFTEESGLCPDQRSDGVECCRGTSVRESRCRRLGGECMNANCRNLFERASDCGRGERCCMLL